MKYILAIDQGTSSTKTILFDEKGKVVARGIEPLHTNYLADGFVEQDPAEIISNVLASVKKCVGEFRNNGGDPGHIAACGISNQRETFLLWDKSGTPLCNAVVWQCKRSISVCEKLKDAGHEQLIRSRTGLVIDPYFSGSKLLWLHENNQKIKTAIDSGEAYFGTIDTWLLYNLSKEKNFCTDYTNASRTLLFNLKTLAWDEDILELFGIAKLNLPKPLPSTSSYGTTDFGGLLPAPVAISAMIGDSHAAAFGERCFEPGTAKATLGTGCSILMNIGDKPLESSNGMITTICWSTSEKVQYAFDGIIVSCGATIEWMKNEMQLFSDIRDTEDLAGSIQDNGGVYLIPAFSGLGAPHWDMTRKASIHGLTFSSTKNHLVRAALESVPYQIKDVVAAMESDSGIRLQQLMVDGGMSANKFIIRFLAELLEKPVVSIGIAEVSALGAAYLAGLHAKVFKSIDQLKKLNTEVRIYNSSGDGKIREWYQGWQSAIKNNR